MTTVAYRDGVLACDLQGAYGGSYENGPIMKVQKTKDGRLIGVVGDAAIVTSYASRISQKACEAPVPELEKDCGRVVEVMPSGAIFIHEHGGKYSIGKPKFAAWGSGSDAARGALEMGADAVLAIKVAAKIDCHTGKRVRFVRF